MDKKKIKKRASLIALILAGMVLFFCFHACTNIFYKAAHTVPYEEFQTLLNDGKVDEITINFSQDKFSFSVEADDETYYSDNPRYDDFKKDLLESGVAVREKVSQDFSWVLTILFYGGMIFVMNKMLKDKLGNNEEIGVDGKESKIRMADVAGLKEVKADMQGIIDILKDPKKYEKAGAKLPKGVLFHGPSGTGKTHLAKAVAGEAGVNFISLSGSDFSNKYVGVGGDRVRSLFQKAREQAPCIVFIDEIDAIGCRRNGNTHSEDRNTLNALLTEMDGFNTEDGVLVMAATNRLEDLDPALIRPGRFDNIFAVPLPVTTDERKEVVNIYANGKKFDETVDLDLLAKQMIGNSPADIEAVMNEASILAARHNNGVISKKCLDEAYLKKVLKGHVTDNNERDQEQLRITAWHEAGHALVGTLLGQAATKVTILPSTSGAGGFTIFSPTKLGMYSKKELKTRVLSLYAGRAAEELLVGEDNVTTGASNDIERATDILYQMVSELGMCGGNGKPTVLNYSRVEGGNKLVLDTMNTLADEYYKETVQLLTENRDKLDRLATELLEKETLSETEIAKIIK